MFSKYPYLYQIPGPPASLDSTSEVSIAAVLMLLIMRNKRHLIISSIMLAPRLRMRANTPPFTHTF
jgi:hypothetical protein